MCLHSLNLGVSVCTFFAVLCAFLLLDYYFSFLQFIDIFVLILNENFVFV